MAGFGAEHRDAPTISSSREIWGGFPGSFTFVTTTRLPAYPRVVPKSLFSTQDGKILFSPVSGG